MTKLYVEITAIVTAAKSLLDAGRKIESIKLIRASFGWGLKESKDFCENGFVRTVKVGDLVKYAPNPDYHDDVYEYVVKQRLIYQFVNVVWCLLEPVAGVNTYRHPQLVEESELTA